MNETETLYEQLTRTQVNRPYAELDPSIEWETFYPVVCVYDDGRVGIITGLLDAHGQPDSDDYALIDVLDGRVARVGGFACDAAALISELEAAGIEVRE